MDFYSVRNMETEGNAGDSMSLQNQVNELQLTLQQLLLQVQNMQDEIVKLENENDRLRSQLAPSIQKPASMLGGRKVLQQLYEDGFHVCPADYGKEHEGGCLFCLEVLKNVTNR